MMSKTISGCMRKWSKHFHLRSASMSIHRTIGTVPTIARVRHHFKVLNLSYLYASQGAEELLNIRHYLKTLFSEAGEDAVKTHLQDKATSCEQARINSWQSAAYRALSASEWYCIGGFA
jgi:hypothetical protein